MAEEVRTRQREQETLPGGQYEMSIKEMAQFVQLGMNGNIVVKESDRDWEQSPQGMLKFYLVKDEFPNNVLQDWYVYVQDIQPQQASGKQRQQGGMMLFVIEGQGSTEVDGERIDWEAGDCLLLPLQPDGAEYVHSSRGGAARCLAFVYVPGLNQVASELTQVEVSKGFSTPPEKPAPGEPKRKTVALRGYDAVLSQRAAFVERQNEGSIVVRGSEREWQMNRQGHLKYFLLPPRPNNPVTALNDWSVFAHNVKKQSGKHRHQGGLVLFAIEGEGATEVNGERIEWEAGDLILLPLHPDGIEHVHFNRGTSAMWLAFIYQPIFRHVATELTQTAVMPEFQQTFGGG